MAEQAKQSEQLALHAHHILNEISKNQNVASRCPECGHCKRLEAASSAVSESNFELSDILQENNSIGSPAIEKIDFDSSFLEDEFSIMSPAVSGFSSNAPPTPFSLIDYTADHLSGIDTAVDDFTPGATGATEPRHADTADASSAPLTAASTRSCIPATSTSQTEAAMHMAASKGQNAIVSILLRSGVDIDAQDRQGRTPLFIAVENGHEEVVEILLAAGADPSTVDTQGTSVLLAAVKHGRERIVEMLVTTLKNR
jgi:hypothetical protein